MEYPFERAAMRGEEMPNGLSECDMFMFLALRLLYKQKTMGIIDREQGSREKRRLETTYKELEFQGTLLRKSAKLWKNVEMSVAEICKDEVLMRNEKVRSLLTAIYGANVWKEAK